MKKSRRAEKSKPIFVVMIILGVIVFASVLFYAISWSGISGYAGSDSLPPKSTTSTSTKGTRVTTTAMTTKTTTLPPTTTLPSTTTLPPTTTLEETTTTTLPPTTTLEETTTTTLLPTTASQNINTPSSVTASSSDDSLTNNPDYYGGQICYNQKTGYGLKTDIVAPYGNYSSSSIEILYLGCYSDAWSGKVDCPTKNSDCSFCVKNTNDGKGNYILVCVKENNITAQQETTSCTESDGGNYNATAGTATISSNKTIITAKDSCQDLEILHESYCGSYNASNFSYQNYNCTKETKICKSNSAGEGYCANANCIYSCTGKQCGDDDGCGGICNETCMSIKNNTAIIGCDAEFMCTITPIICPSSGEQTKTCKDIKCNLKDRIENIPCTPGACGGCELNSRCIDFGTRLLNSNNVPSFCDTSGAIIEQKQLKISCQNSNECLSNLCTDNECVELTDLVQNTQFSLWVVNMLCKIAEFLGIESYQACVAGY